MRVFIIKILIFLLPVAIAVAGILTLNADKGFCYNYIKGDCDERGLHLYNKLNGTDTINYVFIGSSKTMNAINDSLIERINGKAQIYNAGYCRYGRNLDYLLSKDFITQKHISKLFLEVREDESTNSHPMFPYLAKTQDITESAKGLNLDLFSDVYKHILMNLDFVRKSLNIDVFENTKMMSEKYGFNTSERVESPKVLENYKLKNKKNETVDTNKAEYRFSNFYLDKIKNECSIHKTELIFIYLPSYGNADKLPAFKNKYELYGKVILAPDSIFNNKNYWKDESHFNLNGAIAYTRYLSGVIAE